MTDERESTGTAVLVLTLVACTVIGIFGAGQMGDVSVAVTWIWIGIGLSVLFLLYRIAVTLEWITDALDE